MPVWIGNFRLCNASRLMRCCRQSAFMESVVLRTMNAAGFEHVLNWHKTESSLSGTMLRGRPEKQLYGSEVLNFQLDWD
jgi:hypothetical protein